MPDVTGYLGSNPSTSTNAVGRISVKNQLRLLNASAYGKDGLTSANAGVSAAQLKSDYGYNTDGVYWINLPTAGPTQIYCLMNNQWNGGGWMMAMKATRGTTFNYSSTYWTTYNTLNPSDNTRNDGDAKFHTMNYFSHKDMLAIWPDIGAGGSISGVGAWTWLQNNYRHGTRMSWVDFNNTSGDYQTLDTLQTTTSSGATNPTGGSAVLIGGNLTTPYGGYYVGNAKSFSGWASGVFSSQAQQQFYGFNYGNYHNVTNCCTAFARVRWGFGWNNDGEPATWTGPSSIGVAGLSQAPGSNDVSGGVGMDSNFGNYSAGDVIGCCNDTTGINRSARVEVYIR